MNCSTAGRTVTGRRGRPEAVGPSSAARPGGPSGALSLYGTREDVQTHREYIHDMRSSVADSLRRITRREAAASVPDDNWQATLKLWIEAVVDAAAEAMPSDWEKRLGGTDIFLTENLNTIAWSLLLD